MTKHPDMKSTNQPVDPYTVVITRIVNALRLKICDDLDQIRKEFLKLRPPDSKEKENDEEE